MSYNYLSSSNRTKCSLTDLRPGSAAFRVYARCLSCPSPVRLSARGGVQQNLRFYLSLSLSSKLAASYTRDRAAVALLYAFLKTMTDSEVSLSICTTSYGCFKIAKNQAVCTVTAKRLSLRLLFSLVKCN